MESETADFLDHLRIDCVRVHKERLQEAKRAVEAELLNVAKQGCNFAHVKFCNCKKYGSDPDGQIMKTLARGDLRYHWEYTDESRLCNCSWSNDAQNFAKKLIVAFPVCPKKNIEGYCVICHENLVQGQQSLAKCDECNTIMHELCSKKLSPNMCPTCRTGMIMWKSDDFDLSLI